MNIQELLGNLTEEQRTTGFWYLASPYSKYPKGPDQAMVDVAMTAGELMNVGLVTVGPITGSHPITKYHGYRGDYEGWRQLDEALISSDKCHGIIVAMLDTWDQSYGISEETRFCVEECKKPVWHLTPMPHEVRYDGKD